MSNFELVTLKLYPIQGINSVSWRKQLHGANGFFVLGRACYLQGVLHSSPLPDCIEDKKSGGQKQSILYSVSAGSDLRMSTLRPNPLLSIEIDERRGEFRGLLQFLSRPN